MTKTADHQFARKTSRTFVTGFGPFGSVSQNPSSILAAGSGKPFEILEVSFAAVDQFLNQLPVDTFDVLIMLGVAAQSERMRYEQVARNWNGTTPDVRGIILGPGLIDANEPAAFTLSPDAITEHIARTGTLPGIHRPFNDEQSGQQNSLDSIRFWELSNNAGEYLCNYIYFRARQRFPQKRVQFIHVPPFEVLSQEIQSQELDLLLRQLEQ